MILLPKTLQPIFLSGKMVMLVVFRRYSFSCLLLLFLWTIFSPTVAQAQIFPVTGNVQLKTPSPFLSDYSAPDNTDLQITLLYTDINNPVEDVQLRVRIEGSGVSVVTKPNAPIPSLTLTSGLPTVLTGADLVSYLAVENLIFQGYTATQYRSRAALPDGFYSICVDVYSAQTKLLLSQGICTQAFLSALELPILNSPAPCGTKLTPTDPLNIVFSWTPMHSSPASIEYVFELFWVPQGRNPNDIALNSTPWFTTTTFATAYQYGFSDLPLQTGETYAWRVQAKDVQGRSLFVRNGISPVCHFVYGEKCIPPINPEATVESAQRVVLTWDNEIQTSGSTVEYREYEGNDTKWYPVETNTNRLVLTNVKSATKYEWRVFNRCGAEASSSTPVDTFRTRPSFTNNRLSCNENPNLPRVDSTNKLQQLQPGDKIRIADFLVTIVSASGSNGRFNGTCTVPINLLNTTVSGTFTNLGINFNYEAYDGEILLQSLSVSFLSPAVRTQIAEYMNNINTAITTMNGGLGTVQNGVSTGTAVLEEINNIINTVDNLPDETRTQLNEIKKQVQNGLNAMQSGDTTEGKNILLGATSVLSGILNVANEGIDKLKIYVAKVLSERRDTSEVLLSNFKFNSITFGNSSSEEVDKAHDNLAKSILDIQVSNEEQEEFGGIIYYPGDASNQLDEATIASIKENSFFKSYFQNKVRTNEALFLYSKTMSLYDFYQFNLIDANLVILVKDIRSDMRKVANDLLMMIIEDKAVDEEKLKSYIRGYINNKIDKELKR